MKQFEVADFIRLEAEVWKALVDGDMAADARLLSDDFLGVYPSGMADRAAHVGQLAAGPTVEWYELSDARLLVLSDSAVMLSYRAESRAPAGKQAVEPEAMYVSSLWCNRDGNWINVFSQDTPADPSGRAVDGPVQM